VIDNDYESVASIYNRNSKCLFNSQHTGSGVVPQSVEWYNRIMSVYVLLRTVVPCLLRAKVDRHNWGPTTSCYLWSPRLTGYSLLYFNYDHQSLIETFNCVVLVLNTCGENRARLRRDDIAIASCPSTEQILDAEQLLDAEKLLAEQLLAEQLLGASYPWTEQLLDAEQLLAERLLAERLLDARHLSHRRLARIVVTNLESLLLRLAEKSSHVHITERVLYTEVQRMGSVAYHRDPAAIRFDLP